MCGNGVSEDGGVLDQAGSMPAAWRVEGGRQPAARTQLPGWLVVGSTGRNSGKTRFACAILDAFHRRHPITGVKVTTITDGEPVCPRGSKSCGICSALEGPFEISEEHGESPGKDTSQMQASGACRVFWLRCRRDHLRAGLSALRARLDPGGLVVAESNSLARLAEPDLFLMLRSPASLPIKPSAAEVMSLAHRVVRSPEGGGFDLNLRDLDILEGRWRLLESSAAILAGGQSRRMGQDKSLLHLEGQPLIARIYEQLREQFDEILVSTNAPEKHAFLGARLVPDRVPGTGPLMAIASALEAARHDRVFVVACDIPVIHLPTARRMLALADRFDCVIPQSERGLEPLFAVYRKTALAAMREALQAGEGRVRSIFPRVGTHFFDWGRADWYRNLNTRQDVAAFMGQRSGSWRGPWPPSITTSER